MKKLFLIILIYVSLSATNAISTELGDYQGLLDDIITLNELGNLNEAISKTDLMVKNYAAQSETYSQLRTYVANALFNKANILSRQAILNNDKEKYLEAISSYDLLLTLYDKYQDANLQFYIVLALVVKGEQLEALQKYDLAINCYDKAIERLIFEPDQLTQAQIAQAMINKGVIKFEHKKFDEAL